MVFVKCLVGVVVECVTSLALDFEEPKQPTGIPTFVSEFRKGCCISDAIIHDVVQLATTTSYSNPFFTFVFAHE